MRFWLAPLLEILRRGEAAMLVHVAELKGSGPREAGAQMLVTEAGLSGTIGGGELEHAAILKARQLLVTGGAALSGWKLGPELGQCCGGAVTLAFEPFAAADCAWVEKLAVAARSPLPLLRRVRVDEAGSLQRDWHSDAPLAECEFAVVRLAAGMELREVINAPRHAVWLFGAGHVGYAVAAALAPLNFALTWIDGRAGELPDTPPPGVRALSLAMPELFVDEAPPRASFLVMTHSHPLDEAICEAVLRREDFGYLGLIGSATKRARFRKRLAASGIAPALLDRLVCPIGLPGIRSKDPAAIAVSVAADLLIRRENDELRAGRRPAHAV